MLVLQIDQSPEISALILGDKIEDLIEIIPGNRATALDASQRGNVVKNRLPGGIEGSNRGAER
jgi:hypothetical protein